MKKEEFTNGIENFIIEEVAKHCHDTGQNVFDLVQNENLKSTIDIILNNYKKLFYQINTTNEKQKRDNMNNKIRTSTQAIPKTAREVRSIRRSRELNDFSIPKTAREARNKRIDRKMHDFSIIVDKYQKYVKKY